MSRLRIAFIGKDGIYSTRPLLAIAAHHDIVGVVESFPRNYGKPSSGLLVDRLRSLRNRRGPDQILKDLAQKWGAGYFLLKKATFPGMVEFLRGVKPDVICIASMSQLMTAEALALPTLGTLNVHPSMLPKYRGPNPWFWQYHFMERESGVTVLKVDTGSDTGNILRQEPFPVKPGLTYSEMIDTVSTIAARLYPLAISDLAEGKPGRVQSDTPCPFYARRLKPGEIPVEWSWPIERTWHVLRGTERWISVVPPLSGWRKCFSWGVGDFEKGPSEGAPGSLARDRRGVYLNHPEGKIRLKLR